MLEKNVMWQRRGAGAKFTHSTVTWPELDNYDKKQGFGQCGKRGGVPSWVRAEHLHGLLV